MLAGRSLFRVKFPVWKSASICARSNFSSYFQKCEFPLGLSCELRMERKGRKDDIDRKKQKNVVQVWRAVSTQASCCEGDGETGKLESQLGEPHHSISSSASVLVCENTNPEVLNEPYKSDTLVRIEDINSDMSSGGTFGKHSVSMEVGNSMLRFIKGKWGCTQQDIEQETQVKIIFPSSRKEDSIVIEGNSAESVAKASEKIQTIIDKVVNSRELDYSHFVSLPLAIHPELVDKLIKFQNTILGIEASDKEKNLDSDVSGATSDVEKQDQQTIKVSKVSTGLEAENVHCPVMGEPDSTEAPLVALEFRTDDADSPAKVNITSIPLVSYPPKESGASALEINSKLKDSGIERSIFIKPKTFHLTVLMLKLWNRERVKAAAEVLQRVSSKVLDALENRPVSIRLHGLECMKGSLAKARVLYTPVEEVGGEGRLQRACQVIIDAFVEAGLVMENDAQHTLKLHATIMNVRHRESKGRTRKFDPFDARDIYKQYGFAEWGEYIIHEAHLSQRHAFDENGYYHCCASIPFPSSIQVD